MNYSRKIVGLVLIPVVIASMIGATFVSAEVKGKPFDELWEAIFGLQTRVDDHETNITQLKSTIAALEDRIETLEAQLETHTHDHSEITNTPSLPTEEDIIALIKEHALNKAPDYDSGWKSIPVGQSITLQHGLGLNVLVYAYGKTGGDVLPPILLSTRMAYGISTTMTINTLTKDSIGQTTASILTYTEIFMI
ncbi:MAG: PspA/IM30 family protein [Candidatus Bathyarchaeia archaeon]